MGLATGISSAGLVATINYTVEHLDNRPTWLPLVFASLCFVLLASATLSLASMAQLSQGTVYQLRFDLSNNILACSLKQLETLGSPKLLAALTNDVEVIANAAESISELIVNLSLIIGCLGYLCWLSPPIFLLFFVFMVVASFSYQLLLNKGYITFELARELQDLLFVHFRTITKGTKELKLHRQRRQAFIKKDLRKTALRLRNYMVRGKTIFGFAGACGLILFFIPIGLLLYVVPKFTFVSVSLLSSYVLTILYMINPLRVISISFPNISRANIALNKIESLGLSLSEKTIEPNFYTGSNFNDNWFSLKIINVNHAYGEEQEHPFSLNNINIEFEPGEIIFIVGANGSGKSTLIKLITGLYIPDHGEILFNDVTIDDNNREWYRQQFSAVFYDFYLFDRLIGIDASQQSKIQEYLIQLELLHKVTVSNGLLSTTNLSQGQCKRLALLTAYLEDRPIYIFDEWASDQDPIFKKIFYTKLLPELKNRGKTIIVVTHDDRYFTECDRLIKLDYGRIKVIQ